MPESTSAAHKTTQRVIKKYPNRRLYDTDTSTYITLSEVRQLVIDNQNVFNVLMDAVRCCSLGQITNALFEVGGQYRRSM